MFSKMRIAILLLFIGIAYGRPQSFWDDLERQMEEMGNNMDKEMEQLGKNMEEMGKNLDKEMEELGKNLENMGKDLETKFNFTALEGINSISNGSNNVIIMGNNYRTYLEENTLPNGEYHYHFTENEVIDGVEYLTVTDWNKETKQYDTTYYKRNANDPNAQFVPVNQP